MWISTRAQYGLRALVEIARRDGEAVPLKDVAKRQNISLHYLEQLAAGLRRAGFIRSVRGAKGGYQLARPAASITAYEVVVVMEGSIAPVPCVENDHICGSEHLCGTQDLWFQVDQAVRQVLSASTLEDLTLQAIQQEHASLIQLG